MGSEMCIRDRPDEDASLLVCHVDLHEAILMRDPRKYQPAISQQPPQNVVLFNSGHGTQTNYRPRQGVGYRRAGWLEVAEVRLGEG